VGFFKSRASLGTYDEADQQAQWEFAEILQSVLGGMWNPPMHPWESRRESMLYVFGRPRPSP
jgi:hypothetical protein